MAFYPQDGISAISNNGHDNLFIFKINELSNLYFGTNIAEAAGRIVFGERCQTINTKS
ncbi:MAG: hypothetical protein HZA78_03575 [Candidatus Schekmanbacteria bacterium]|nr:hypothetical protein [Candidatus Schekmanbacteria bacterium]